MREIMRPLHVLRVFTGPDGSAGNPLGVVLDGGVVPTAAARQALAAKLGFSETVFVDDCEAGAVAIYTPTLEMPFAGHPLVGTAWLLARDGAAVKTLRPPAGEVPARAEVSAAYVAGRPEWAPPFELAQLESPAAVEALTGPPGGHDLVSAWAWSGPDTVRARVFPPRLGISEDEATGAAAVRLGAHLRRPVTIHQGAGSVIEVRPRPDGLVEIGGRVVLDRMEAL
jgi:predicted PhzF superfamily epimerase YddE/YHI9